MKLKLKKITAALVAFTLIILVFIFANALVGNPISKHIATKGIKQYLANTYSHTDFQIDQVGYDFKFSQYYAHIISPSSKDSKFIISWDNGEVVEDTYSFDVIGHQNTLMRFQEEASQQIADLLVSIPTLEKKDVKVSFDKEFLESPKNLGAFLDTPYDKSMHLPLNLSISYNTDAPTLEEYAKMLEQVQEIVHSNGYLVTYYSIANYDAKHPTIRINVNDVSTKQIESGSLLAILKTVSDTEPSYVPDKPIDPSLYNGRLSVTSFPVE